MEEVFRGIFYSPASSAVATSHDLSALSFFVWRFFFEISERTSDEDINLLPALSRRHPPPATFILLRGGGVRLHSARCAWKKMFHRSRAEARAISFYWYICFFLSSRASFFLFLFLISYLLLCHSAYAATTLFSIIFLSSFSLSLYPSASVSLFLSSSLLCFFSYCISWSTFSPSFLSTLFVLSPLILLPNFCLYSLFFSVRSIIYVIRLFVTSLFLFIITRQFIRKVFKSELINAV